MFGSSTWGNNNQQQQQQPQQTGGLFGNTNTGGFGQSSGGRSIRVRSRRAQLTGQALDKLSRPLASGSKPTPEAACSGSPQRPRPLPALVGAKGYCFLTSGGGGFGQTQQTNAFGARPAFGATGSSPFGQQQTNTNTGGGLFGSSGATGGFGQTSNTNTGGLFGAKPTTGFGASTGGGLFGASSSSTALNPNEVHTYPNTPAPAIPATGTADPAYIPTWQRDPQTGASRDIPPPHLFHVIDAMDAYRGGSFEELRMLDYQQNRKQPTAQPAAATTGFGQPAAAGFGQPAATGFGQPAATSTFGQAKPGGLFGSTPASTGGFGATTSTFGQNTNTGGGLFGQQQQPAQTGTFGQPAASTSGGLFGQSNQANTSGGLFGAQNTNTFGQNNQQQQQQQQSTGFGFGASKPAFGATPSTGGFGQAAATNTFGQTNNASTGFGFGQQQNQQQPQQQTGGLFGSTPAANTGFGQTNTTGSTGGLFGQNNTTQQPATGGLFGQTAPKPGGLFGNTTTTPATNTGFGFGQNNTAAQPAAGGGLFGQQNTSQPGQTGGLFGQNNTTAPAAGGGLFGQNSTAAAGGGLFGQKPAAPAGGGLFGTTPAAQPAATGSTGFGFGANNTGGGGLFGTNNNTAAPATNSLFGNKPAAPSGGLFGMNNSTSQPAAGGGLFGQNQQSTGLFGSNTQTQTQPQPGGLFGSTLGQSTAAPAQSSLTASVDQSPYGRNELFAYSGQKLELGSVNKKPALPPLTASSFRVTPTKSRVTRLRGFASPLGVSQSTGRSSPAIASPSRSLVGSPAPSDRYKGLTDAALSPNAFIPRASVKKITVAPSKNANGSDDPLESVLGKSALRSSANGSAPPTPDLAASRSPALMSSNSSRTLEDTPSRRPQSTKLDDSIRAITTDRPLKKGDYWCSPKLDKLRSMSHDQLSRVENFTAGRKGFGEVSFLEPVDLTGLPSLNDFLGNIITVESLELAVYPDESNKPPVGKGLNVPAQISLENCYARDKATRQPITDTKDPRYQRQVKRMKMVPETEFISFTDDGVWTFKVEHFSKYGLAEDSDEEDEEPKDESMAEDKSKSRSLTPSDDYDEDSDFLPPTKSIHDNMMDMDHDSGMDDDDDSDSYDESLDLTDRDEPEHSPEWDQPMKTKLGMQGMRNLRAMQASFFGSTDTRAPKVSTADAKRAIAREAARALERKRADSGFGDAEEDVARLDDRAAVKRASFGESSRPTKLRQPHKYAKVPLAESSVDNNEGLRVDSGLALGRSFRCSWGPNGELVHMGKICAPGADFASSPDAVVNVEQVELLANIDGVERHRAERLLSLLLERTEVEELDGEPAAFIDTSIRFKQFAALFDASDRSQEASMWRLGQALFDEIDLGVPETTPEEVQHRILEVRRKLALSKWLEDAVAQTVDLDLARAGDNRPAKVFALLTGNQVERAVQSALDGNDMRLATLVSQVGGSDVFRAEVQRQLDDWEQFKTNGLIGYDYRKLYALLAGITDISPGDSTRGQGSAPDVLVAEGLDWKRAFGLYLWHGCPFEQSIADVLDNYTAALDSAHSPARPLPPYIEKPDGTKEWKLPEEPTDVLFSLIRMYSDLAEPLDSVLQARNASPSPTDFRLPWHMYILLRQALQKRDFADREEEDDDGFAYSATANNITSAYAAQLEESGQWLWAAFVLLHLETAESRRSALRDLLFRHPNPTSQEEAFLTDRLHIPPQWLHEAKAAALGSKGDAYREYFELIPAGLADRAQRTLVSKLAPEAVLRDDHALLQRLCEALEPLQPNGWEYGGKLFLDYLELVNRVRPLLQSVLRAGTHPDPTEARKLAALANNLPRVLQLLPALFPDKDNVQQVASLSDMLSELQTLAGVLHASGYIPRPPVSDLLVDKDRLHLLQGAATERFERSLGAITAS